uniref:Uncharacterized protein n=1 Tax=Globodera rostochiensis TaxID=31243 RepID=A0A914HE72_GLORO
MKRWPFTIRRREESPYETKVLHSSFLKQAIVQVKVPLLFFSDNQFCEVVAYSPGFGRVGSFVRHNNLAMDSMCFAWIAFAALFKSVELRTLMFALDVKWIISGIDRLMAKSEIIDFPKKLGMSDPFNRSLGVVVEHQFCKDSRKVLVIKFSTESNGLCEYCDPTAGGQQQNFPIGSWARFLPIRNFSNEFTAVNPSATNRPNGVSLLQTEPKIKLALSHDLFYLDQDPSKNIIHAQMFGELHCTRVFMLELRQKRQKLKHFQPRLFIMFDPITNRWIPIHFDGLDSPLYSSENGQNSNDQSPNQPSQKKTENNAPGTDFGDKPKQLQTANRDNERGKRYFQSMESRSRPLTSSLGRVDFKQNNRRSYDNRNGNGSRFSSNSSVAHKPTVQTNLQGLIVSVSNNSSNIYTCRFPSEEFSMNRSTTSIPDGVKHGSWVKFDLTVDSRGDKTVSHCEVDDAPPGWKVTPVRNTIQIELIAFVPKKWHPDTMAPEKRIVPTNWIDEMLDFQGLLTEEMADKSVKVVVERNKHPTGKTWHLVKSNATQIEYFFNGMFVDHHPRSNYRPAPPDLSTALKPLPVELAAESSNCAH